MRTSPTMRETRLRRRQVKLAKPVPVELRYETIVVEDGKLHIYRDVYDQERTRKKTCARCWRQMVSSSKT